MKLVVTSSGTDLSSSVDLRFGRAKNFILFDTKTNDFTVHDNSQNLNLAQGAGIQAGQTVVNLGAEALITGNVGPKAFNILRAGGIGIYVTEGTTVKEAIEGFKSGTLKRVDDATVEGHW
jgi:predicted Fe-Mo cluster-binding NifX family protein